MPGFSIDYADLMAYGMQSPVEFAMLQRYDSMDPSTWTRSQKKAYLNWAMAEEVPLTQGLAAQFGEMQTLPGGYVTGASEAPTEVSVGSSGVFSRTAGRPGLAAHEADAIGSDFVRTTNDPAGSWTVSEQWDGRSEVDQILAEYESGTLMKNTITGNISTESGFGTEEISLSYGPTYGEMTYDPTELGSIPEARS